MPRRYTNVDMRRVTELRPGDEQVIRRRVMQVAHTADSTTAFWDDGTSTTWRAEDEAAIEVVAP